MNVEVNHAERIRVYAQLGDMRGPFHDFPYQGYPTDFNHDILYEVVYGAWAFRDKWFLRTTAEEPKLMPKQEIRKEIIQTAFTTGKMPGGPTPDKWTGLHVKALKFIADHLLDYSTIQAYGGIDEAKIKAPQVVERFWTRMNTAASFAEDSDVWLVATAAQSLVDEMVEYLVQQRPHTEGQLDRSTLI
jgi:hypothetical protein